MADIHMQVQKDGIKLRLIERVASGGRRRVKGTETVVTGKDKLVGELFIFQRAAAGRVKWGESNGS